MRLCLACVLSSPALIPPAAWLAPRGASIAMRAPATTSSRNGAINKQLVKAADPEAVLALFESERAECNSVNVATALHRLGTHLKRQRVKRDRVLRDRRFIALVDAAVDQAPECNSRSVSDVLWACATLNHWPPEMLVPMLTQVAAHLERGSFKAQHLSLIVWSLAVLECKPVRLLDSIEARALENQNSLNQQNVANLLWGYAKLNHKPDRLLRELTAKLTDAKFMDGLKPVEVADIAYALAVLGSQQEQGPLMHAMAGLAQPDTRLERFTSRQLVNLIWAFARMGERPAQLEPWVQAVREAHERQPLLARDLKNLEQALDKFDVSSAWLRPEEATEEEEEEEGEGGEGGEE